MSSTETTVPAEARPTADTDLARRVDGLGRAVEAARGRLDPELLDRAAGLVRRAGERLRLSSEHTIVALAGATGSGKSSLFNDLTDLDLAGVGVRRPTTSWALACAWGPAGAEEILEWMGVPARHQVSRASMLDLGDDETNLRGLVLLDLPDHDSTEVSHHLEVDRLVSYADLLVWVLDPQKYADAAIHDRYLKPLATHTDVTMILLNQIDRIPEEEREATVADVRRLLVADGMADVPLLATSPVSGDGIVELKRMLVARIRDKETAKERLLADLAPVVAELGEVNGSATSRRPTGADRDRLTSGLLDAAGVDVLAESGVLATVRRGTRLTAWPPVRWVSRLGSDPVADLGLDHGAAAGGATPSRVQRSQVDATVREVTESTTLGLSPTWTRQVSQAGASRTGALADGLDAALAGADLGGSDRSWWRLAWVVQWLLLLGVVGGAAWWVADLLGATSAPDLAGAPAPLVLAVACLVVGLVLGVVGSVAVRRGGSGGSDRVRESLASSFGELGATHVIAPLEAELAVYDEVRAGLEAARGGTATSR